MKAYKITATAEDSNGVRIAANTAETLGEAYGVTYLSRERANEVREDLESDIPEGYETSEYSVEEIEIEQLEEGETYDRTGAECIGWTEGDGSGSDGYNVADYFDLSGRYLGADEHGIEPIFAE